MTNERAASAVTIWVDADACPRVIRDILQRAAVRAEVSLVFVANHAFAVTPSPWVRCVQVPQGYDVADNYIVQEANSEDLVVTSDIPLAAELIEKGAQVISARGERFTANNVRQRLNMRDFMDTMRASQAVGGGPPALGPRDKQAFANALDRFLAQAAKARRA